MTFCVSVNQQTPLEAQLINKKTAIESWLRKKWLTHNPPFYGSVDLRNAAYKMAPIDMNLFPGGFNHLNSNFLTAAVISAQEAICRIRPEVHSILLIPENHTRNLFYLENIHALRQILLKAGFEVRIASLNPLIKQNTIIHTVGGHQLTLEPLIRKGDRIVLEDGFTPCIILLNNDLSAGIPEILLNLKQPITPPVFAGWTVRTKSKHFEIFDTVIQELCSEIQFDTWLLNAYFDVCYGLSFKHPQSHQELSDKVSDLLKRIQLKYRAYGIREKPFVIMKANSGTYGMGVMTVRAPEDVLNLNRKNRNKMATVKEGLAVHDVILQEGVYSYENIDGAVAEPVVYMMDRFVIGGFYRSHKGRSNDENLNASGMQFIQLGEDISNVLSSNDWFDPHHHFKQWEAPALPSHNEPLSHRSDRFYLYGLLARLSLLAASIEIEQSPSAP
ncbi:MAG: glutamate--cysteine ligase [Neisseriaceae bacterium]